MQVAAQLKRHPSICNCHTRRAIIRHAYSPSQTRYHHPMVGKTSPPFVTVWLPFCHKIFTLRPVVIRAHQTVISSTPTKRLGMETGCIRISLALHWESTRRTRLYICMHHCRRLDVDIESFEILRCVPVRRMTMTETETCR